MGKNILEKVLEFEENKKNYSVTEQNKIRKSLLKEANKNLKKIGKSFLKSIDELNDL